MIKQEEKLEEKEYIITYGFRRYSACKKLGWTKIPCYLKDQDQIIELPIDKIQILEKNTRLNDQSSDFQELMQSIKENGLLQPIGVTITSEYTKHHFLTSNVIENIHRKNISPIELGKACQRLKEEGLNLNEIAIRLSQPKERINTLLNYTKGIEKELENVEFKSGGEIGNGKLAFNMLRVIGHARIDTTIKTEIFKIAKENQLTIKEVQTILLFISQGMTLKEAHNHLKDYKFKSISIILNKEEYNKSQYKNINSVDLINKMLIGQIPINPKLFYYQRQKIYNRAIKTLKQKFT